MPQIALYCDRGFREAAEQARERKRGLRTIFTSADSLWWGDAAEYAVRDWLALEQAEFSYGGDSLDPHVADFVVYGHTVGVKTRKLREDALDAPDCLCLVPEAHLRKRWDWWLFVAWVPERNDFVLRGAIASPLFRQLARRYQGTHAPFYAVPQSELVDPLDWLLAIERDPLPCPLEPAWSMAS
jgi:hypothetical protein